MREVGPGFPARQKTTFPYINQALFAIDGDMGKMSFNQINIGKQVNK